MAKHRIRRWFQFGVLDLLILMTVVGIGAVLSRPVQPKANNGRPWIFGAWGGNSTMLFLLPDRTYLFSGSPSSLGFRSEWPDVSADPPRALWLNDRIGPASPPEIGADWTISPHAALDGVYLLRCGNWQLLFRPDLDSATLNPLNEDEVRGRMSLLARFEGTSTNDGAPDGAWRVLPVDQSPRLQVLLEYRNGELIDFGEVGGVRHLAFLNQFRSARGLPPLSERDFPDKGTPEEKTP